MVERSEIISGGGKCGKSPPTRLALLAARTLALLAPTRGRQKAMPRFAKPSPRRCHSPLSADRYKH